MMPSLPRPDFIVVEAHLALAHLERFLYEVAFAGDLNQLRDRHASAGVREENPPITSIERLHHQENLPAQSPSGTPRLCSKCQVRIRPGTVGFRRSKRLTTCPLVDRFPLLRLMLR